MTSTDPFLDRSGPSVERQLDFWEPIVIRREQMQAEIERLSSLPAPAHGRRESLIVHPRSAAPGLGLAPGIQVSLSVLNPGERTAPIRHNSTAVNFCIGGGGRATIGDDEIGFGRYDVWNTPCFTTYHLENDTDTVQARLTYSNAALLEKLRVHLVEEEPVQEEPVEEDPVDEEPASTEPEGAPDDPARRSPFGTFELADGAWLMPYETLISPPTVASPALHWRWREVKEHLDELEALGETYRGRRLYLLHNPMTGRTNGTTPSFFATITIRPPGIVDRPHRHVSAAINYFFHGSGRSVVAGQTYEWAAGDLMLSAPGWAIHHHASHDDDYVYELTVQDQPLHLAIESLLWQEDLTHAPRVLGSQPGFATNRPAAVDGGHP